MIKNTNCLSVWSVVHLTSVLHKARVLGIFHGILLVARSTETNQTTPLIHVNQFSNVFCMILIAKK